MGVVFVAGVPGVGKTTLLERVSKACGFPVVAFGSVMLRVAQSRHLVSHRDQMRRLSMEEQLAVQRMAANAIATLGTCLLDTHMTVPTPQGVLPGIPSVVLQSLRPSRIIIVEARPAEILARRGHANDRQHDVETAEQIDAAQALNRAAAMACATLANVPVKIVFNHEGQADEAVKQMLAALQGVPKAQHIGAVDPFVADVVATEG